jgi:aryl-alcohol dehydrogenase-like predicted oxidoreductase
MRYRNLGDSGLRVSVVGLGCNNFGGRLDLDGTRAVVDAALDAGITLLDTADIYGNLGGSETLLGQVLEGRREQVVLATKFGGDMGGSNGPDWDARGSRRYVRRAIEASLRRLRTDYLDLYQLHFPDLLTPLEETVAAMQELVTEGKVRYLGHSNLAGWQIADADWIATRAGGPPFVSAQNHYSLLERGVESEVLPSCLAHGVGLLPYFPLAQGLLTGKVTRQHGAPADSRLHGRGEYLSGDKFDRVEALDAWAVERGLSLLDLAVGALAARPGVVSVIAGATRSEQVRANVAAGEYEPGAAELADIDRLAPVA